MHQVHRDSRRACFCRGKRLTQIQTKREIRFRPFAEALNGTDSALDEIVPSNIHMPFGYIGAAFLLGAFLMLLAYLVHRDDFANEDHEASTRQKISKRTEYIIVALMCLYCLLGVALEQTYSSMCSIYAVDNLGFSKSSAAFLASVFWGCFTFSRIFATLLSLKVEPLKLIISNHVVLVGAAITLTLFPLSEMVIWTMTGLFAFALSPFFGNVCGWALKYIFLSHNYMSAIFLSVCIGASLPPITIGPFLQKYPMSFMYANLFFTFIITLNAAAFVLMSRYLSPSKSVEDKEYGPVKTAENES